MSWRASAYIKEMQQCPNGEPISRTEKLVALILADSHQDKTAAYTYPSVVTIADDACMDPRTCRRILAALERKGIIQRIRADNQGRGQLTFYSFPELDKSAKTHVNGAAQASQKGGQNARLFFRKRRTEGGPKEDKTAPATKGKTGTETQKQKLNSHIPLAGARGRQAHGDESAPAGLFDAAAPPGNAARTPAIEAAVEQVMSGCTWTRRRLRDKLRAVLWLELDKGTPPATTALTIMATWQLQNEKAHLLRVKYGPSNFLEFGIWKHPNLLQWDHARVDQAGRV